MEDLNTEIEDLIAEGDQVVAWVRATGTPTAIGIAGTAFALVAMRRRDVGR